MTRGIQLHVPRLSLSNTTSTPDNLAVQRSRNAVHGWAQKAGLQPDSGAVPNQRALNWCVIRITEQPFWLYAAVDTDTRHSAISVLSPWTEPQ